MSKLELEILRNQRMAILGRDLGGFVHNAAGPLNVILGYIQVLRAKYPDEKGVGKIWDSGIELDKLLKELGSHVESLDTVCADKVNVNKLISRQMELLRANNYFKHNIEANEDLCESNPSHVIDYGDLVMLIDALLNNAIQAVYESDIKKIFVSTELIESDNGMKLEIIVRDTGNGVNPDIIEKCFEPGFSGWNNTLGEVHGMGLTLAKYICERNKGKILVRNSDGIGAEAVIEFSVKNDEI